MKQSLLILGLQTSLLGHASSSPNPPQGLWLSAVIFNFLGHGCCTLERASNHALYWDHSSTVISNMNHLKFTFKRSFYWLWNVLIILYLLWNVVNCIYTLKQCSTSYCLWYVLKATFVFWCNLSVFPWTSLEWLIRNVYMREIFQANKAICNSSGPG